MIALGQESILSFLKRYWWVWLLLFLLACIIIFIGPNVVGKFIYKAFSAVFYFLATGAFFYWIYKYTFGRGTMGVWGIFRLIGCLGIIGFLFIVIYRFSKNDFLAILADEQQKNEFFKFWWLILASLFLIGFGELLLYIYKLNYKLKLLTKPVENNKEAISVMTCARCLGKGYVDKTDISRMDMEGKWSPGWCNYCAGMGNVETGRTIQYDPSDEKEFPQIKMY